MIEETLNPSEVMANMRRASASKALSVAFEEEGEDILHIIGMIGEEALDGMDIEQRVEMAENIMCLSDPSTYGIISCIDALQGRPDRVKDFMERLMQDGESVFKKIRIIPHTEGHADTCPVHTHHTNIIIGREKECTCGGDWALIVPTETHRGVDFAITEERMTFDQAVEESRLRTALHFL